MASLSHLNFSCLKISGSMSHKGEGAILRNVYKKHLGNNLK